MQVHRFQYERMAHHADGCGLIRFSLRREEGPFEVELTVEDARSLFDDLRVQLPIANGTLREQRRISEQNARLNTDDAIRKRTEIDF
jgi:hypothetical protein